MSYIFEKININSVNRNFLLSILMKGNKEKYFNLNKQYKEKMVEKEDKRLHNLVLPVYDTIKTKLMEYNPIDV